MSLENPDDAESPLVSIVVPCHNEEDNLALLYERMRDVLDGQGLSWEMVCVNDGSKDSTLAKLIAMQQMDPRVRVFDLSRNFGKEAAMTAGLDQARGSVTIPIDADLQDPPELIPALIAKWREGYEVVNAVREARDGESWVKRSTAHLFYRIINGLSDIEIPRDTGDFRLLSRPALEALRQMPERRRFMKGMFVWVGFRTATVTYRRAGRHAGRTSWNYWRLWNFALEGITSFSQVPLRLASYLGLITAFLSMLYGSFLIVRTIFFGNQVSGYPSIMVAVLFLGGIQLMALGVIGEYVGRIYEETKSRPLYLIRQSWSDPAG
ncbi:glycosyltransferase family 2 protein [Acidisoma cellulosilyticum]|uniref:glycosyltransferase family 2 protein n=1 Tax=Acidisoma cellulosilyticum TaxID=2802395 RepID=UPI001D0A2B75|nr:glycosyltransferase family 2 protein [Acidisoma cellulosilyticum]